MKERKKQLSQPVERARAKRLEHPVIQGTVSPQQIRTSPERAGGDPGSLLAMQRSLGNRTVQRLLNSGAIEANPLAGKVTPAVQRQAVKGEIPATGRAPSSRGMAKVFAVRDPWGGLGPGVIRNMVAYFQKTLGKSVTVVNGMKGLFDQLLALRRKRIRVNRLIIVVHGSPKGEVKGGDMTEPWVAPQDLQKNPKAAKVRQHVMAKGAIVEFWACKMGRARRALKKWSKLFGAEVRATKGRFEIERRVFRRDALTSGEALARGSKVQIKNTNEIYNLQKPKPTPTNKLMSRWRPLRKFNEKKKKLVKRFDRQLLKWYNALVATREIPETKPRRDKAKRLDYMRKLFNRSGGIIRYIHIRTAKGKFRPIRRPGRKWRAWLKLWKRASFSRPQRRKQP